MGNNVYKALETDHEVSDAQIGFKPPSKEDNKDEIYSYIHLKDARIYSPQGEGIPSSKPLWWRGKLSSVDGFIFGSPKVE